MVSTEVYGRYVGILRMSRASSPLPRSERETPLLVDFAAHPRNDASLFLSPGCTRGGQVLERLIWPGRGERGDGAVVGAPSGVDEHLAIILTQ